MTKAMRFAPEGELSIYCAAEQKQQLMQIMEDADAVELDLSKIGVLDSAGLQLLILARQESQRRQKPFNVVALSSAVSEVFELCNLSGLFGQQEFLPSKATTIGDAA